jgi:hypothetical protein
MTATPAYNKRPYSKNLIITPQELKDIFLFGVDLTNDDGDPYPEEMFEFYILSAQQWLETQMGGLMLCEKKIEAEVHDYWIADYMSYSFIKLFRYPVQSVEKVEIQFPLAQNVLQFDPAWYRAESVNGIVNLVPTQGTFSSILLSQGGNFLPLLYQGLSYVPSLFRVTYTAGFKKDEIPVQLKEIVGMKAAMGPLNIAGDLIAGAGIATKSIGLDGLSQSISTTSSATNAGYGARILQYNKEIEERMKGLREYYGGINFTVA